MTDDPAPSHTSTETADTAPCHLVRRQDQVVALLPDGREIPVRLVRARPISEPAAEVSLLDAKKKEVLLLSSLAVLDPASRSVADEALAITYLLPRITRINTTSLAFGTRYWDVETDRGPRRFAMRDPRRNVSWRTPDHAFIRDVLGCRYEIASVANLDAPSRLHLERVL